MLTRRDKEGDLKFEPSELKIYDSNTELHQIITEFSKLLRPLFVKNEEGDYGIFSIYEFKQDHVFPQFQAYIYDAIEAVSDDRIKTVFSVNSARYAMPCLPTNRKKRKRRSTRFVMLWFVRVERLRDIGPRSNLVLTD